MKEYKPILFLEKVQNILSSWKQGEERPEVPIMLLQLSVSAAAKVASQIPFLPRERAICLQQADSQSLTYKGM